MLKGRTTYSPTWTLRTAEPTSTTWPMFSCPRVRPRSNEVRPSYMCRSEPQILVVVILTMMSQGCSIFASGTSFTVTVRGPSYTAAFMVTPLDVAAGGKGKGQKEPDSRKSCEGVRASGTPLGAVHL